MARAAPRRTTAPLRQGLPARHSWLALTQGQNPRPRESDVNPISRRFPAHACEQRPRPASRTRGSPERFRLFRGSRRQRLASPTGTMGFLPRQSRRESSIREAQPDNGDVRSREPGQWDPSGRMVSATSIKTGAVRPARISRHKFSTASSPSRARRSQAVGSLEHLFRPRSRQSRLTSNSCLAYFHTCFLPLQARPLPIHP